MGSDDMKIEIILQADEVSQVLKALAGGFRHAIEPESLKAFAPHLGSCTKLELTIKQLGSMAEMKLKVKGVSLPGAAIADSVLGPVGGSFKAIKKRMKTSFKFLQHSVVTLTLPPVEIVDAFLKDSLAMCAHQDRGAADYGQYMDILNDFKSAFDKQDRVALADAMDRLNASKKACHALAK
ncbi:MAG: GAK system XXXCH domain-containing protein [Humidesulfovibrio sp.]|nr:GAK system XXXCH domain-containing protein [Humidesulfovibrio sp.]